MKTRMSQTKHSSWMSRSEIISITVTILLILTDFDIKLINKSNDTRSENRRKSQQQRNSNNKVTWLVIRIQCTSRCDYFSLSSVVSRAFSALCMYSKFRHHSHPLGYLCAKFHFFRSLHCWASPWRKITYSISHSPSLFDVPWTEACASN